MHWPAGASPDDDPVSELVRERGLAEQSAVRLAVEAERAQKAIPLRERVARVWEARPLPHHTGQVADKAFYDEL